jgi:hypothetical protein
MRTRLGASACAVLLALGLAACGSDRPVTAPKPAPSPSPTVPPGLEATPPVEPAPQADTKESAVAYGGYFARLVQYAVRTRNASPVFGESYDQARCSTCRQLADYVAGLKKDREWEVGDDLELGRLAFRRDTSGGRVTGKFTYPSTRYVSIDGSQAETGSKALPYVLDVDLRWDESGGGWRVVDYTFDERAPAG